ncbi:MAG: hypothetical protein ABI867_34745 [Kofleriaceae bacterium]
MRLGTCIALELAVAAGATFGVWTGVGQLRDHAGAYLTTREAVAATEVRGLAPEAMPRSTLPAATPLPPNNIYGAHDDALLAPLGIARVTKTKLNHGGTSLSLRVDFANGARAAFKPEQIHPQSDPRREIAAFRIDRLLEIGHVPPAKETELPLKDLLDTSEPGYRAWYVQRLTEEATIRPNGMVRGELSWWIPEIKLARLSGLRIDERDGRELWTALLQVGVKTPVELRPMLAQISTCILFDVLIDNADRWSGSNTEMSPDGKLLFFMDNTLSFSWARYGHEMNSGAMRRISVFSRGLVAKLRALTHEQLVDVLAQPADTKLGPLLNPVEVEAILYRRDNMLRYIDQLVKRFGEDAVLAFP